MKLVTSSVGVAVGLLIGSLCAGCSKTARSSAAMETVETVSMAEPSSGGAGQTGSMITPPRTMTSARASAGVKAPPRMASTAGQTAAPAAAGAAAIGGVGGGAPASMVQAGAAGDTMPARPMDCSADATPWPNPGQVEDPAVEEVEATAGKGVPFGHAKNLATYDYVEKEFLFSGKSPAFTSRFVVLRPSDPAKFSGTVFVEWYNVSGGMDVPVMWSASQAYFMREGHAYVSVSAQAVGANALRDVDAARYEKIDHPGDTAANAVFSRAGVAVRLQTELLFGPCIKPKAVIALGQSQSSARLSDYVASTQPNDKVYDAILLHSGGNPPSNDPAVPVFVVKTMNEGNGSLGDGPNMIEWAVAGASHNDKRLTEASFEIVGEAAGFTENPIKCMNPMNDFPAYRVYNAVLDWLARWVRDGERPPMGTPFETMGNALAWDEHMNVRGGVRLPDIEVPIKSFTNSNGPMDALDLIGLLGCGLAGSAVPFTPEKLLQLYPTHDDYVQKYIAAADKALMAGYLLKEDYDEMVEAARAAPIPK